MLQTLYYTCWVLLMIGYATFIATLAILHKKKIGIKKFIIPFALNLFSLIIVLPSIITSLLHIVNGINVATFCGIVGGLLLIPTTLNILLYFLYYKKKKKLTTKEYILASAYSIPALFIYFLQINLI